MWTKEILIVEKEEYKSQKGNYKPVKGKTEQKDIILMSIHVYNNVILNWRNNGQNYREKLINLLNYKFRF